MPNYAYHFARTEGRLVRELYRAFLSTVVKRKIEQAREIPIDVFSYSGESSLPEQIASIRSFLECAGRPASFTVMSDGTYSSPVPLGLPPRFSSYLRTHPTGKQLALIMSLPRDRPALYIDSDVMFFRGSSELPDILDSPDTAALYLEDCGFAGDERLLRRSEEKERPVNTGVLVLFKRLNWSLSIDRFVELKGEPDFFTNQTLTHLAIHANGARPLDPSKYVLQLDDQFVWTDRYAQSGLVLRHYVNPVRHKFWTSFRY
jgi:hypothetical protein